MHKKAFKRCVKSSLRRMAPVSRQSTQMTPYSIKSLALFQIAATSSATTGIPPCVAKRGCHIVSNFFKYNFPLISEDVLHSAFFSQLSKDIPAQWDKIRQGLEIFRIGSKCVCLSNGEV